MNLFKRDKILEFQDLLGSTITLPEMVDSLTKNFSPEIDVKTLFLLIDDVLQLIRKDQELIIENTAMQALSVHIAFLVDKIKKGKSVLSLRMSNVSTSSIVAALIKLRPIYP